jgi:hypothetical protein
VLGDCSASDLSPGRGVPADPAVEEDIPALAGLLPEVQSSIGPQGRLNRLRDSGRKKKTNGSGCVGCCGGACCLLPDTPVLLADGGTRRIDALSPGDLVLAYDEALGRPVPSRVTAVLTRHERQSHYVINGELGITDDHPVARAIPGGIAWTPVEELILGDRIVAATGAVEVRHIAHIAGPVETVYVETQAGSFIVAAGEQSYVISGAYGALLPVGPLAATDTGAAPPP